MSEKMGGEINPENENKRRETIEEYLERTRRLLLEFEENPQEILSTSAIQCAFMNIYQRLDNIDFSDYNPADLMKINFDALSSTIKNKLQNYQDPRLTSWVGDRIGHLEEDIKDYYSECTDSRTRNYAEAVINISNLFNARLDEVLNYYQEVGSVGMVEIIEKFIQKAHLYKEDWEEKPHYRLNNPKEDMFIYREAIVQAMRDLVERFSHPFLTTEEKKKILQELIDKLEAAL